MSMLALMWRLPLPRLLHRMWLHRLHVILKLLLLLPIVKRR